MNQELDIKKVERNTYLRYSQDGIWDIFVGLCFIIYGVLILSGFISYAAIIPAVLATLLPSLLLLKKKFTQPRMGIVIPSAKWKDKEAGKKRMLVVIGTISVVGGLVNFFAFSGDSKWLMWLRDLEILPFGIVLSLLTLSVGIIYLIKRYMIFSAIIFVIFLVGHFSNVPFPHYFILVGIVFTVTGLFYLANFIKKYPLETGKEINSVG